MIAQLIKSTIDLNMNQENFENSEIMPDVIKNHPLSALITLLVIWIIILLIGKFLWNNAFVPLAPNTVVKAKNIWQILGLCILIQLLKC